MLEYGNEPYAASARIQGAGDTESGDGIVAQEKDDWLMGAAGFRRGGGHRKSFLQEIPINSDAKIIKKAQSRVCKRP